MQGSLAISAELISKRLAVTMELELRGGAEIADLLFVRDADRHDLWTPERNALSDATIEVGPKPDHTGLESYDEKSRYTV
jgi:hypothetical protein